MTALRPLLLFAVLAGAASAQLATISGVVRDADGLPLPGTNVYLSGTTIGDAADAEGRYRITGVPPGAYRLVASLVGFQAEARSLRLTPDQAARVDLTMTEAVSSLGAVAVEAEHDREWERRLSQFVRAFLGESENADSTRILNPEVLSFRQRWGTLRAEASAPLVIENRALGYRLTYDLAEFESTATLVRYDGGERFAELVPADSAEAERWRLARDAAYRGSLTHLLQAMMAGTEQAEGFRFEQSARETSGARPRFRAQSQPAMETHQNGWGTLHVRGQMRVVYVDEPETERYVSSQWFSERARSPEAVQRSSLSLDGASARIDPQGTPEDPYAITASGHMGFERLADRVPEGYRPEGMRRPGDVDRPDAVVRDAP